MNKIKKYLRHCLAPGPSTFADTTEDALFNAPKALKAWSRYEDDTALTIPPLTLMEQTIMKCDLPGMTPLLDKEECIEQRGTRHWTPLIMASANGFLEGVKLLIKRGANVNATATNGLTCLSIAARNGHLPVVSLLLEQNLSKVEAIGSDGYTALHHLVLWNDAYTTNKLIRKGAEINAKTSSLYSDMSGEVPVLLAVKHDSLNCLRVLLENGADPNIARDDGTQVLWEAVQRNNVEAVRLLLKHGADRTKTGKDSMKPLDLAVSLGPSYKDIIDLLLCL